MLQMFSIILLQQKNATLLPLFCTGRSSFFEQIYISGMEPELNKSRLAYRVEMTPEVRAKIGSKNRVFLPCFLPVLA